MTAVLKLLVHAVLTIFQRLLQAYIVTGCDTRLLSCMTCMQLSKWPGRKLIATRLTIHWNGNHFCQRGTFGCQNWSPGPILAANAEIGPHGPGGPFLGRIDFGVQAIQS